MALKLNEKYPGYMNAPSIDYPQGSFKNRTSPTAEDGSYFDQDWANDDQGFKQSLLSAAGVTANGQVDKVGASQYFDALKSVIRGSAASESLAGVAKVATQSKVDAGSDDSDFLTSKKLRNGFSSLFSSNGYLAFPSWLGGLIIQWGSGSYSTNETITFPLSFPSSCYFVNCGPGVSTSSGVVAIGFAFDKTKGNFKYTCLKSPSTGGGWTADTQSIMWFALGK